MAIYMCLGTKKIGLCATHSEKHRTVSTRKRLAALKTTGRLGYEQGHLKGIQRGTERQKNVTTVYTKIFKVNMFVMEINL